MAKIATPKDVIIYTDAEGREPFNWLDGLRDKQDRKRIETRLLRLEQDNYGDCEPIGEGVSELRIFFGPGYRVYFGEDAGNIVVFLCGCDKDTQTRDI